MSFFATEESVLTGAYSQPFGLGFETELIQRAVKAQIIKFLPELTEKLQEIWDIRDKEFAEIFNQTYKKLQVPIIKENSILSGVENLSLINAPVELWPFVLIYARDSMPYQYQEDQFDTVSIPLRIEVMCNEGPIKEEELHTKEGIEGMQILDSKIQRLSDAVYLCIRKDPTLCGTVGTIEKPPKVTTSLPWARKENGETTTGQNYIFQGKQFDFNVQKISS